MNVLKDIRREISHIPIKEWIVFSVVSLKKHVHVLIIVHFYLLNKRDLPPDDTWLACLCFNVNIKD